MSQDYSQYKRQPDLLSKLATPPYTGQITTQDIKIQDNP